MGPGSAGLRPLSGVTEGGCSQTAKRAKPAATPALSRGPFRDRVLVCHGPRISGAPPLVRGDGVGARERQLRPTPPPPRPGAGAHFRTASLFAMGPGSARRCRLSGVADVGCLEDRCHGQPGLQDVGLYRARTACRSTTRIVTPAWSRGPFQDRVLVCHGPRISGAPPLVRGANGRCLGFRTASSETARSGSVNHDAIAWIGSARPSTRPFRGCRARGRAGPARSSGARRNRGRSAWWRRSRPW